MAAFLAAGLAAADIVGMVVGDGVEEEMFVKKGMLVERQRALLMVWLNRDGGGGKERRERGEGKGKGNKREKVGCLLGDRDRHGRSCSTIPEL